MRITKSTVVVVAASFLAITSACERKQADDQAAPEAEAAADDEANEAAENEASEADDDGPGADTGDSPAPANAIVAIPAPEGWARASAKTPKGATVSFAVPGGWVELKPPNDSTLFVRGAPIGEPGAGTQVTAVVRPYEDGLDEFVKTTKDRLSQFAQIESDGPARVAEVDGYEFVAKWATPVGSKDTVQFLTVTETEGIGITCALPPAQLDRLRGLCDEIFATLSIE